jgi:hypothetical protein
MSRCIITDGCKGNLISQKVLTSYSSGEVPAPSLKGLQDWVQRKIYYKFNQQIPLRLWKIKHNLGTNPVLQIYKPDGRTVYTDLDIVSTKFVDPFSVEILFRDPCAGIIECFALSPASTQSIETKVVQLQNQTTTLNDVTGGNILTLAVPPAISTKDIKIWFISPNTNQISLSSNLLFTTKTSSTSPWFSQLQSGLNNDQVFFFGKTWNVVTARVDDIILAAGSPVADYSPFFFSSKKSFSIIGIDINLKTITVNGLFDDTILPTRIINTKNLVTETTQTFTIVKVTTQTSSSSITSTITVKESQLIIDPSNSVVEADYPITSPEVAILLTKSPYTSTDRDLNNIINLKNLSYSNITQSLNQGDIVTQQRGGQLHIESSLIQFVYPPIVVSSNQ